MKAIIGVLPLWDDEKESMWMLPGYFAGIEAAGGVPIMLPMTQDKKNIEQLVDMCNGFLFTGGHDVSPQLYGRRTDFDNVECCEKRDYMESQVLRLALEKNKAVLGICRGIQFLNAFLGGDLYQDLPSEHNSKVDHHQEPPYNIPVHNNRLIENTALFNLLGKKSIGVNSYHHQAIKTVAAQLEVMAVSEDDLVEAVQMPEKRFVWAVQWHPEFCVEEVDDRGKKVKKQVELDKESKQMQIDSEKIFRAFVKYAREV